MEMGGPFILILINNHSSHLFASCFLGLLLSMQVCCRCMCCVGCGTASSLTARRFVLACIFTVLVCVHCQFVIFFLLVWFFVKLCMLCYCFLRLFAINGLICGVIRLLIRLFSYQAIYECICMHVWMDVCMYKCMPVDVCTSHLTDPYLPLFSLYFYLSSLRPSPTRCCLKLRCRCCRLDRQHS